MASLMASSKVNADRITNDSRLFRQVMQMKIRRRYLFTGDVQGVGFRFMAYHGANSLGLTGWVRNEYDGSVALEIQGERSGIDALLEMIGNGHYIRIDSTDFQELPVDPYECSFQIRD